MKKTIKSKSKHRSIFIRATDSDELSLITELISVTGHKAASQAFIKAGKDYLQQRKTIEQLQSDLTNVNHQLIEANNLLARLNNSQEVLAAYSKRFLKGKHLQWELF